MPHRFHVAVLAFPFGTHAAPLLALLKQLAGSTPTACFSFFNTSDSNRTTPLADRVSTTCPNVGLYDVWNGIPDGGHPFTGSHLDAMGFFLEASPENFETAFEVAERHTGLKISCLISDAFLWFACDLAERRRVPWLPFWAACSSSLVAHVYTDEIVKAVGSTGEPDQALPLILPGLPTLQISDLPPGIFLGANPSPIAVILNKMVLNLPKSTAVILNSFEELDPIATQDLKSKFKHFLNVGPTVVTNAMPPGPDDKTGCLSWLEKQTRPTSVVYISFGSMCTPPENELFALAEALEACRFPFLWSLKDEAKKSLPESFLQRTKEFGKIVPWAPQMQILGHSNVGVFVTHCGWNSIMETISGGVPLVCRPFIGDHKLNCRMVEDSWKIGVKVKGGVFTKNETIDALQRVMSSEGKEIRENVLQMKQKLVNTVKPDGSCSKNFKKLLEIIESG